MIITHMAVQVSVDHTSMASSGREYMQTVITIVEMTGVCPWGKTAEQF